MVPLIVAIAILKPTERETALDQLACAGRRASGDYCAKKVPFFTNRQLKPSWSSAGSSHFMKMWPKMHMFNCRLIFPGAKAQAADVRLTIPRLECVCP